ncbi:restriction endonuclease subunit S [Enterococcus faecium]|uniref:restriction endonuclease subunit S n=1 Tax=Enterococcus faecium TaxID=1352 RepID=UPI0010C10D41|nr:restriction endonuclease subunit S [Enterococcus faecium]
MSNDTQPEIRFPGFTEDWEERKLGEVTVKIGSGKTPKGGSAVYSEKGIPLLRSQNIYNDRVNFNDIVYITKGIDDSMANSHVLKDDVLLNITGASIGRSAVYSKEHLANVNQHVCIIRPGKNVNPFFIQLNITSPKGQKEIELNQAGGGREGLNFQQIARMTFFFPNKEEQAKIGTFFKQLDDTIALHQRKLDLLKETKKGFLQKMFPKNGAKVPEIRFPGFTGDWEERKLSEMAGFSKGNGYSKADLVEKGHPVILYGRLYTKYETVIEKVDTFAELKEKSVISNGGEVIVPASGETPEDISRASVVDVSGVALGGDLNIIKTKSELNPTFLALTISNGSQQKEMTKRAQGKSVVHLHNSDLKEVNLLCPKLDEQVKIGSFFKKLDVAITLHQRKLDLLKETKKGFLQKMFV